MTLFIRTKNKHLKPGLAIAITAFSLTAWSFPPAHASDFNSLIDTTNPGDAIYHVLASTDQAIAGMPQPRMDALLRNKTNLIEVLNYHVLPGWVLAYEIVTPGTTKSQLTSQQKTAQHMGNSGGK